MPTKRRSFMQSLHFCSLFLSSEKRGRMMHLELRAAADAGTLVRVCGAMDGPRDRFTKGQARPQRARPLFELLAFSAPSHSCVCLSCLGAHCSCRGRQRGQTCSQKSIAHCHRFIYSNPSIVHMEFEYANDPASPEQKTNNADQKTIQRRKKCVKINQDVICFLPSRCAAVP